MSEELIREIAPSRIHLLYQPYFPFSIPLLHSLFAQDRFRHTVEEFVVDEMFDPVFLQEIPSFEKEKPLAGGAGEGLVAPGFRGGARGRAPGGGLA